MMAPTNPEKTPRIQDFIFYRELSEVYLLLDHISGRWDKTFYTDKADSSNMDTAGPSWLLTICEIGWPPHPHGPLDQARQAAALLRAKDMLNAAAKPANGATIAFTLMVMGEDTPEERTWTSRWLPKIKIVKPPPDQPESKPAPGPGHGVIGEASAPAGADIESGGDARVNGGAAAGGEGGGAEGGAGGAGPGGSDGLPPNPPPNRISLARIAFPGLVGQAASFTMRIRWILRLLAAWLVLTCLLSWNVAAGNVILSHLDAVHTQRKDIEKKIADSESKAASRTARETARAEVAAGGASEARPAIALAGRVPGPVGAAGAAGTANAGAAAVPLVIHYCDQSLLLPSLPGSGGAKVQQFHDVDELHLCDMRAANEREHASSSRNLESWLGMWRGLFRIASGAKWNKAAKQLEPQPSEQKEACDEETGRIVALLLGGSVLPLCYGILGAGAAVVRDLWAKMRESLLSPRDYTLALGQLALGATIGACISLFISPAGAAQAEGALIGGWGLSASALSFVAGFGVESVFVALESLVRRVFNNPDPAKRTQ
jgi:hypothetical protein